MLIIRAATRPSQGADRERQVQTIFSEIAPRYDLLNHVLSMNIDRAWRRRAVDTLGWVDRPDGRYLDACAGTFDLSLELARRDAFRGSVIASDFARPMLVAGQDKLAGASVSLRSPVSKRVTSRPQTPSTQAKAW